MWTQKKHQRKNPKFQNLMNCYFFVLKFMPHQRGGIEPYLLVHSSYKQQFNRVLCFYMGSSSVPIENLFSVQMQIVKINLKYSLMHISNHDSISGFKS